MRLTRLVFIIRLVMGLLACAGPAVALSGCRQDTSRSASSPTLTPALMPHTETSAPTATIPPPPTSLPTPTATSTRPIPTMPPTRLLPTLDPTVAAERLRAELRVEAQSSPGGRPVQRIGGWVYGLRPHNYYDGPYLWLDDGHLLLYPISGLGPESDQVVSQPAVLDLASGRAWAVPPGNDRGSCDALQWSVSLGRLVIIRDGELQLLDLQGNVTRRLPVAGEACGVHLAPSGRRAWVSCSSVWLDLESGRQVAFERGPGPWSAGEWSADETRIFNCCYYYADARTGSVDRPSTVHGLYAGGSGLPPGRRFSSGRWLAGDRYFLPSRTISSVNRDRRVPAVLVYDPAERVWVDVLARAGLPDTLSPQGGRALPSPDGTLLAVGHYWWGQSSSQPVYIVEVSSFTGRTVAGAEGYRLVSWSGDGQYVLLSAPDQSYRLVSAQSAALEPTVIRTPEERVPIWEPAETRWLLQYDPVWESHGSRLAYVESDGRRVSVMEAATGRVASTVELPVPASRLVWSERGGRLAVLAVDGSLWWLREGGGVEQLTPPLPGAGSVRWSPGAERLTVATGSEVYVIGLEHASAQP